jgi:hypothetical protein
VANGLCVKKDDVVPVFFLKAGKIVEGRLLKIKRNQKILIEYSEDGKRRLITKRINSLKGLYKDELQSLLQKPEV